MSKKNNPRADALYLNTLSPSEISILSDDDIRRVKVPNMRDEFTGTTRIYELGKPLNITSSDTIILVKDLRDTYNREKQTLRAVCKDLNAYIMCVLRWRNRGLSQAQAKTKVVFDCESRLNWQKRQRKYWS